MSPFAIACLIWNLRNILARFASDTNPDDSGEVLADSYATAYDAFETSGFRMYGAFGNPGKDADSIDPLTGATGFDESGEPIGLQCMESDASADYDSGENLNHSADEYEGNGNHATSYSSAMGLVDTADMSDDHATATVADARHARMDSKALRNQASELGSTLRDAYASFYAFKREGSFNAASDAWRTILDIRDSMASLRIEADEIDESAKSNGRWAHYRDAHCDEMLSIERNLARTVGKPAPLPGEMSDAKESRERYAATILRKLERMRQEYRNAAKRNDKTRMRIIEVAAKGYKSSIRKGYTTTVRNLAKGKDDTRWRFLPLTKAQLETLGL